MTILEFLMAAGVPTAITGLIVWWFKRSIEKRDMERLEREKNVERLMMHIMLNSRATNVLAEATAKAVQRIPDAHCNGDMKAALEKAAKIQAEEKEFIMDQGIKHIFED